MLDYLENHTTRFLLIALLLGILLFTIAFYILRSLGKSPKNILPVNFASRMRIPLVLFLGGLLIRIFNVGAILVEYVKPQILSHISTILLIISFAWISIILLKVFKRNVLNKYDFNAEDNYQARKVYTQLSILERVIIFVIILLAVSVALMSFDSIRSIGMSMLASAGIAGIIIGFAAQKALGTLLAGIQIAFSQPIRLDDVVVVEGEWGRIEEIYLTYVVVKIWDKRRLVLPTTYFIEKPFQNWTRNSSDILGTVFIYTDYQVPFDAMREELTRILESTDLWDGEVNVLQVTDTNHAMVETRALMSSKDSPTSWDLRVLVREKLVVFLQENYPESLPRTRVEMQDLKTTSKAVKNTSEPERSDLLKK